MIPDFNNNGVLPEGVHEVESWDELVERFSGTPRRNELLDGLAKMLRALAAAGCRQTYLNGSFVTTKEAPRDFDLCYEQEDLDYDILDAIFDDASPGRQQQKAAFGGEALPNITCSDTGQIFVEFFQNDKRTGGRKGIVSIDPRIVQ